MTNLAAVRTLPVLWMAAKRVAHHLGTLKYGKKKPHVMCSFSQTLFDQFDGGFQ
jgi:hypothetical protein